MNTSSSPTRSPLFLRVALVAAMSLPVLPIAASAADVSSEVTFVADAHDVWAAIGPFCAISEWYPGIESCSEEKADGILHRRLVTADGAQFLEKLVSHDDSKMTYSYTIEEGPLPVQDYTSRLSVSQSGEDTSIVWEATFEPKGASEAEAVDVMRGVFNTGLEAIQKSFMN